MGMSAGGGGGRRAPLSEINVTPLVDVMLVLLIIFMVTAPLLTATVEVDLPNADAPETQLEEEKVLLIIDEDARVFLMQVGREEDADGDGRTPIPYDTIEQLEERITTNALILAQEEIFIQGDENVRYGFVAQVLAMIRQAGVEKVGLVTDPRRPAGAVPAAPVAPPE